MAHIADDTPDRMVRAVVSKADAAYWRGSLNQVLARVLREGKTPYERP